MLLLTVLRRAVALPSTIFKYWLTNALRTEQGSVVPMTNPIRLRMICEELGGMYIKFGQILAMRFDIIPLEYATELMNLLDHARPIANEVMFDVLRKELRKSMTDVFNDIEYEPLATASFAQVYRATYRGEQIVIKIQKPNLDVLVRSDLLLLSSIAWLLDMLGLLRAISCRAIVQQLKDWSKEELDYRHEAEYNSVLQAVLASTQRSNIIIPRIFPELTTRRVLVQTYLNGYSLKRMLEDNTRDHIDIDRKIVTHALVRDMMCQYFIDGSFHADPHPANLFIFPKNRIGYVDFGITGTAKHNPLGILMFINAATKNDHQGVADGFMTFIENRLDKEVHALLDQNKEMMTLYTSMLQFIRTNLAQDIEPITTAWHKSTGDTSLPLAKRSSAITFLKMIRAIEKYHMKFPSDIIAFIRALLILDMVCLRYSAEFNMIEAARSFFDAYPFEMVAQQLQERYRTETQPIGNTLREQEKQYATKERLLDTLSVLIEKYPEFREILTQNTI